MAFRRARRAAALPGIELVPIGVDRAQLVVEVPMDGQSFAVFPSLHRTDVALQIGRDILPGVQSPRHPVVGIVSAGGRTSGGHLVSD